MEQLDLSGLKIEHMSYEHVAQIAELEKLCFSVAWSKKSIEYEIDNKYAFFYVAILGQSVVGYAGMHIYEDEGIIANICTHPQYEGNGIGRKLVSRLIEVGISHKLSFLMLEVRESNFRAKGIYSSFGFQTKSVRKGYYKKPTEDADVMFLEYDQINHTQKTSAPII